MSLIYLAYLLGPNNSSRGIDGVPFFILFGFVVHSSTSMDIIDPPEQLLVVVWMVHLYTPSYPVSIMASVAPKL